jgi:hypothetical protein
MTVHRERNKQLIYVDQAPYSREVMQVEGVTEAKPKWIPLPPNQHKEPPGGPLPEKDTIKYRHTVEELMYLANMKHPDLSYSPGSASTTTFYSCKESTEAGSEPCQLHIWLRLNARTSNTGPDDRHRQLRLGTRARSEMRPWLLLPASGEHDGVDDRLKTGARSSMEAEYMAPGEAI